MINKLIFLLLFPTMCMGQATVLKVQVKGFQHNRGKLMLQVLDASQQPLRQLVLPIENKQVLLEIKDLPAGQYSVRVYHDANDNRKLDTGLFGIPKESWGMSNNVKAILGPPDFKESLFWLKTDKIVDINLK